MAVRLLSRDALDVDEVLETIDGSDLAFSALIRAAHDCDFIVFTDGN